MNTATTVPRRALNIFTLALAYLAFISIGLPDGLLGTAWPSIYPYFRISMDSVGALLLTYTGGYLLSSFCSGWVLARASVGTLLAASCAITAASLAAYAAAPAWGWVVALGGVAGLGAGAIDAGLNTYAAVKFSPRAINWMHASYAAGAAVGPVLMTRILASGLPWQAGYVVVAGSQLLLALCFMLTRAGWQPAPPQSAAEPGAKEQATLRETLSRPIIWTGNALFFVYTGIEAAVGIWAYSLLTGARGVAPMAAGGWLSLYWGGLMTGRLLLGAVASRQRSQWLLTACIAGLLAGTGLLWSGISSTLDGLSLGLIGLAAGPIFPTLIALTPDRVGERHAANAIGFQVAAATLGQSLLPGLAGILGARYGIESVANFLMAATSLLFLMNLAKAKSLRKVPVNPAADRAV